jgi:hypothetical protein
VKVEWGIDGSQKTWEVRSCNEVGLVIFLGRHREKRDLGMAAPNFVRGSKTLVYIGHCAFHGRFLDRRTGDVKIVLNQE